MSRMIESQLSLAEAQERILALAEPGAAIEVSLGEALGLVLAEPVVADVDHPPFDRASHDGYAVRADEATVGSFFRVVRPRRSGRSGDAPIETGEAARVKAGDPIPPGADTVLRPATVQPDPDTGPTRVIEIRRATRPHRDVTPRGAYLQAGATVAAAGSRVKPAMIPLLAAQGCVHPFCHRRVRVSILSGGNHWGRPDEAPSMNRERNAANLALVALTTRTDAMPHDFQAVAGSQIRPALERATTSPVVLLIGSSPSLTLALRQIGFEWLVCKVKAQGIGLVRYGVIRDDEGKVANHVFQLPPNPVSASVAFSLLVGPLVARLQGQMTEPSRQTVALAEGELHPPTGCRARVVPVSIRTHPDGRPVAEGILSPPDDLNAWAQADGSLIFPEQSGPWGPGDCVAFQPIVPPG